MPSDRKHRKSHKRRCCPYCTNHHQMDMVAKPVTTRLFSLIILTRGNGGGFFFRRLICDARFLWNYSVKSSGNRSIFSL